MSSRHLITTGKKAILARRLHEALHLTVPATTANSASSVTASPPTTTTQTSINSSTPTTVTVTSTTNPSTITELPPALQQQFSTLMQQYISNAALQPNLSPASDCTSTLPQSVNAAALTFTQASANYTSATNAPLYQVAGHRPAMYQLPAPLQLQNPQHTHPQQLPATSTLQQILPTTTLPLQQLLPAATLPSQQLLSAATSPPQQPAPATLLPQQLAASTLPPQQMLAGSTVLPQQLLAASTLPPVPAQLHQQIVQGEYIDFNTLLTKTTFVDTMGQSSSSQQPALIKISSFASWMEAWNIYLSIRLCSNPERALELIGYQRLICSANKLLPLNAWLQYDNKFRTIAASNTHLRWDQRHPDLWLEALALGNLDKQSSKRWPCPYCKATTHFPENCPRSPFRDNLEPTGTTNHRASGTPICGDFNNGNCTRRVCSFKHICLSCKGNHPRISCSSRRPPYD